MIINKEVQPLFEETGNLHGVYISASKWFENKNELESILFPQHGSNVDRRSGEMPEPMKDWDNFFSYWDFNYPEEKNVLCKNCGSHTEDWTVDEPRKFKLKAANLGGQVSFQCQQCQCRVTKKHFKDHICYEYSPYTCAVK